MILFIAILVSLAVGYAAGAFVMAFHIIKALALEELTGTPHRRAAILRSAVHKAVAAAREATEER